MAAGVQHGTATQFPGLSTAGSHHSNVHVRVIPNVFNNYRNQQIKRRNYHLKRGVIPGGGSGGEVLFAYVTRFHTLPVTSAYPVHGVTSSLSLTLKLIEQDRFYEQCLGLDRWRTKCTRYRNIQFKSRVDPRDEATGRQRVTA